MRWVSSVPESRKEEKVYSEAPGSSGGSKEPRRIKGTSTQA